MAPAYGGAGRRTLPRYRTDSVALHELATEGGRRATRQVTWRQGSRGAMRSRFRVLQVRPAGKIPRTLAAAAGGSTAWDGVLPTETLLVEWPPGEDAPAEYSHAFLAVMACQERGKGAPNGTRPTSWTSHRPRFAVCWQLDPATVLRTAATH
ncbi:hypothetical protein [Kitasatospora sp. NPDC056531]|uniref:hypothetical protein n=1 Tax=Kitasatospora sp. NPDC056531 TaxID=3345856 RepID=UPI00367DA025